MRIATGQPICDQITEDADADVDGIGDVCDACSIVEGTPCDDADACTDK